MLKLPSRTEKPRHNGLTAITDKGIPLMQIKDFLNSYSNFLDIAKFGIGSGYVDPLLDNKISVYKEHGIEVYLGGTLFEKFYVQKKLQEYLKFLSSHKIDSVEISTGVVDIALSDRVDLVKFFKDSGIKTVYAEVGSKDVEHIMAPYEWVEEMSSLIEVGCNKIIAEGRDNATAGIYRANGEVREGLVKEILNNIPAEHIIFEAPTSRSQMHFINLVGANVNVGNVMAKDLLLLETQRLGLRYETFMLD